MAKKCAMILGWILIILGVLGFVSNPIIGSGPGAFFLSDTAHNLVHLVSGAVLLWAAYAGGGKSAMVLKVVGGVYLLIALLGFFAPSTLSGLMMMNGHDNWLHLILAGLLLWGGMSKPSMPSQSMPMGTM